ncbi:hypothetical protein BKA56DRAFT_673087 [Ilyonectria sp. MPI-CAGE-AT-0026]|nr:hypothetical protein BKA56DRAFT_673087 [Ilyonectria sp. MPI-CAGE-AT-0026]
MFSFILLAASLPALVLSKSLPAKTLDQLSLGTWFENLAVRPNGNLLVTQMAPSAALYTIRDPEECRNNLEELVSFPSIQSIYGITQVPVTSRHHRPETFIVVGSNATGIGSPVIGSFGAWAIEFHPSKHADKVQVRKVSDMSKKSRFLNGVASIPDRSDAILVADSANGLVGRLDLSSGIFDTSAFVFPEMAPIKGTALPIGVNGIKVYNGHLYWTWSYSVSIYRIAITPAGLPAKRAKPELVADLSKSVSFLDDFVFDTHGNIYAASNFDNTVVFINTKSGKWETVVGAVDQLTVAGSTSVAFGRGKHDKNTLYVSTSGALANPVNGTKSEGSKVVAVNTRS